MKKIVFILLAAGLYASSYGFFMFDIRGNIGVPAFYTYQFQTNQNSLMGSTIAWGTVLHLLAPFEEGEIQHFGIASGVLFNQQWFWKYVDDTDGHSFYDFDVRLNWVQIPLCLTYAWLSPEAYLTIDAGGYYSFFNGGRRSFEYGWNYGGSYFNSSYTNNEILSDYGIHIDVGLGLSMFGYGNYPAIMGFGSGITIDISLKDVIETADESLTYWGFSIYLCLPFFIP